MEGQRNHVVALTLMYFGKRRASRINLFWSCLIMLMIVSDVRVVERAIFEKWADTLFINL